MFITPLSHWIGFHVGLLILLALEWVYARYARQSLHTKAIVETVVWAGVALAFSLFLLKTLGSQNAVEYLAGYALEESLSIDNLFVFLLLFKVFRIEDARQPKVLFWGVAGAIVMRGAFIVAGLGLLNRFHWISYAFGAVLLVAAARLVMPEDEEKPEAPRWIRWITRLQPVSERQDAFFVMENGRRMMTMLFLALLAIETTDLVFAMDSIPAVLSITRHPFVAYTSNIMAVMGLRSLYFLLAHLLKRLRFLHYGLAAVLGFAGVKMIGSAWFEVGPLLSLAVIVGLLGITVVVSLTWREGPEKAHT